MSANSYGGPDNNPFEDPAVRQVTNQVNNAQSSLDGYNPFEGSQDENKALTGSRTSPALRTSRTESPTHQGAMQSGFESPPAYSPTGAQDVNTAELHRRQEELERKAAELQAREEALRSTSFSGRTNNWPPLPKKCCVGPCFYQDISVEIPTAFQKTVRLMYYMWMFYTFLLFLNMLGALALFIANGSGTTFGVSILVFVLFTPMSYVCWFRPLYKAFRSDSSFNFMVFFFVFFFQFIVAVFYAVGLPNLGSCGLLNGITTLGEKSEHTISNYTVGIIAIFIGFLWAIDAIIAFFMLVKIHRIYRSTGASFAKAQEELASGVMRNEHVQNAASAAITNAARQATNPNPPETRY